jgi:hypothetical protein
VDDAGEAADHDVADLLALECFEHGEAAEMLGVSHGFF